MPDTLVVCWVVQVFSPAGGYGAAKAFDRAVAFADFAAQATAEAVVSITFV